MITQNKVDNATAEQAADWYLLMQGDEPLSEQQLCEFIDWLKDPVAENAYSRCEALWELSGALADDVQILACRNQAAISSNADTTPWWRPVVTAKRYSLLAACIALVAMVLVWNKQLSISDHYDVYQTATGQQKTVTLSDGSQLTLNTSSEVHVSYRKDIRKVMLESGEVLFDVAKDQYRPFSVTAGNGKITALGTIFNVKKSVNQQSVEVALLEGKIEVNANIDKHGNETYSQKQLLSTNQMLSYTTTTVMPVQSITDIDKITQWREGRLSFSDATLADIVEQVNRYTINKLVVDDQQLQAEKLDAYFVIGDTDTLLLALKETLGISWAHRSDGILLYREVPSG